MSPKFAKDQPAGFVNRIQKVALVGAGGNIGGYFAKHLLAAGKHQITAISRAGSKSTIPEGIHRVSVDYNDESSLVEALRGQDFLIITLGVSSRGDGSNASDKLINAAAAAGVPYVMPNAYGPDPRNDKMTMEMGLREGFRSARALVEKRGVSSWIALACGFWYEWSLVSDGTPNRFGIGFEDRTVTFFDQGEEKITTTTWDQCGRAAAGLLALKRFPEDEHDTSPAVDNWANKAVYVASFRVSQKDMFESAKRVTGTTDADWKIEYVGSEERYKAAAAVPGFDMVAFSRKMYTRVFFQTGEGDHSRYGLANAALGLPEEDIDESTKEGLRLAKAGILKY